jgi:dienelactone hydrolase
MALKRRFLWRLAALLVLAAACSPQASPSPWFAPSAWTATPMPAATATPAATAALPTATESLQASPTATATLTAVPSPTPTPDPYAYLTIESLRARSYGGGAIVLEELLADNSYFSRWLFSYPSDDLTIYGFVNLPKRGQPPYPVVIMLHGYIEPEIYQTQDYTTGYADTLTRAGYLVLHPNLRGYPPSDEGENPFRIGMAIDVLNLIARSAGAARAVGVGESTAIGLWGHSMGGGAATRVMTVNPAVRAVVLYAAMSGDERQNYEAISRWSDGLDGQDELAVPEEELLGISPQYYYADIQAAVSVHHGEADTLVPLEWSLDLCEALAGEDGGVIYPGSRYFLRRRR